MDANHLEDPAHIDIADIEGDQGENGEKISQLRKNMIDGLTGSLVMENPTDLESGLPLKSSKTYYYKTLEPLKKFGLR